MKSERSELENCDLVKKFFVSGHKLDRWEIVGVTCSYY